MNNIITTSEFDFAIEQLEMRKLFSNEDLKEIINQYKQQQQQRKQKKQRKSMLEDGMLCGINSFMEK